MKDKKRDKCLEQSFGLYGRRWGWDDLREQHQNTYIIKGETDHQPRLDAWDKCSGLVHWEDRGMGWRGKWVWGSGWGTHVNPWLIHVNVWQKPLQYCKVISLQLIKINGKKIKEKYYPLRFLNSSLYEISVSLFWVSCFERDQDNCLPHRKERKIMKRKDI